MISDPSGEYTVGEVTVHVDGVEVTKGGAARGLFVAIGHNRDSTSTTHGSGGHVVINRHPDPRTDTRITLMKSSAGNAVLSKVRHAGKFTLAVRRLSGETVYDGDAFMERDPRELGDEKVWNVIIIVP